MTEAPNSGGGTESAGAQGSGLATNIASALAYIPIVAIIWLVLEPYNKDKTIRFHAFQALGFAVCWLVLQFVLMVIPIVGWILLPFVALGLFIVWVICVFKAYNNDKFNLPVIGDWAAKQAG